MTLFFNEKNRARSARRKKLKVHQLFWDLDFNTDERGARHGNPNRDSGDASRKYERYQSERVDGASCLCSDDVTMMVSDGGDKLIRWSSGPDHIEPTLGPCLVRTARSGEAGQLDAAPPRATPKTVSHNDTYVDTSYHISIHMSV